MRYKLIKSLTASEKRYKIILNLSGNSKSLSELSKIIKCKTFKSIASFKNLELNGLIESNNGKYKLTESGKVVKELIVGVIFGMNIIEKYKDFWNNHDISSIPNDLLRRIYELGDCAVAKNSSEDIYELHEEFIRNVELLSKMYGISSVYHPEYPLMFLKLAKTGKSIDLILTESVFNKVRKKNPKELKEYLRLENAKMYVIKDAKLAMVVSDKFLYLSLYFKNGIYDVSEFLISYDESALMWGKELFDYYLNKSKKIDKI